MKKILGIFFIGVILLAATAFAEETSNIDDLVKNALDIKGVSTDRVNDVKEVDFTDLPKQVNLENIDDTNLALYEVVVDGEDKPMYIITASSEFLKKTVTEYGQRMLLNFGFDGEHVKTTFLKTATGVVTSLKKGYVMTREGSIVGLSTNLEVLERSSDEPIEIIIYKNSREIGFRNAFNPEKIGIFNDHDIMSSGILNFDRGDVISLEVKVPTGTKVSDITVLLEIEANR